MTRISRYIIWEMIKVFSLTLTALTLLIVMAGLVQQSMREGLGLGPTLQLIPYVLPNALRFAVPGTILFATCSVFGRISAANEVVAIKSLGISPLVILRPAMVLAFVLSLLAVWLNDVAVSWGQQGVNRVIVQSVEEITYGMLETHRSYSTDRYSITVRRVDGRRLISPTFTFHTTGVTLHAEEAELTFSAETQSLRVALENCEFDWGDEASGELPDSIVYEIPLATALRRGAGQRAADLPLRKIPAAIQRRAERIEQLQQQMAADAAYLMLAGDLDQLTAEAWQARQRELQQLQGSLPRLHTEPWRRWANGFSCFFFVLVGAPLAVRLRLADFWVTFFLCFLPILLIYYPLLAFGLDRAKVGELPPYFVWTGNVFLAGIGGWLLRITHRQ